MSEEKKDRIARCIVDEVKLDLVKKTVSFKATLTGKIKSGESWKIENARTKVWGVNVPIVEFIVRVLCGWFWVRKVQDVLRKGNAKDAQAALDKGYDWTAETTTKAKTATPKELIERGLAAMTADERAKMIAELIAEQERLNAAEQEEEAEEPEEEPEEEGEEAEEDEDFDKE